MQLRALEREAKTQRDLLESYLAKYREASARDNINAAPPEARIISRAVPGHQAGLSEENADRADRGFRRLRVVGGVHRHRRAAGAGPGTGAYGYRLRSGRLCRAGLYAAGDAGNAPHGAAAMPLWCRRYAARAAESFAARHPALRRCRRARSSRSRAACARRAMPAAASPSSARCAMSARPTPRSRSRARWPRTANVVLVDLAFGAPNLSVISTDPNAPGIAELMRGQASFGDIITRDQYSQRASGGDRQCRPRRPGARRVADAGDGRSRRWCAATITS